MNITIKKQRRRSMALQLTPKGIRILIPNTLNEGDERVQAFIRRSLENLPNPPSRIEEPHTPEALNELVERWASQIGVTVQRIQLRKMTTSPLSSLCCH